MAKFGGHKTRKMSWLRVCIVDNHQLPVCFVRDNTVVSVTPRVRRTIQRAQWSSRRATVNSCFRKLNLPHLTLDPAKMKKNWTASSSVGDQSNRCLPQPQPPPSPPPVAPLPRRRYLISPHDMTVLSPTAVTPQNAPLVSLHLHPTLVRPWKCPKKKKQCSCEW